MVIFKKYTVALALASVAMACAFFFFYRIYKYDMKSLTDFTVSYEKFDQAISTFSNSKIADSESKAGDALVELNAKANFRLSSLIKHEKEVMAQARVVAELSGKELGSLKLYKKALQNNRPDLNSLAKEYIDFTSERKAAYTHFEEFAN